MKLRSYLWTGQTTCHDTEGNLIDCAGSGQDAEYAKGIAWPEPRFGIFDEVVLDRLTGLSWTGNANISDYPLKWQEALDFISAMNSENTFGYSDWRLPNRRELRSLMSHQTRKPALPVGHPFRNVFSGWYWTSTTDGAFAAIRDLNRSVGNNLWRMPNINELESLVDCSAHNPALPELHPFENVQEFYWSSTTSMFEPDWAWALYLSKGAIGVGQKRGAYFFVWPVCDSESLEKK